MKDVFKFAPQPTLLSLSMWRGGLVNPHYAMPGTHMSMTAYIQSGGPFGAFVTAMRQAPRYAIPEVSTK